MILKSLVLLVAVLSLAAIGGCAHKNASEDMGMKSGDSMGMNHPTTQPMMAMYTCEMHPDVTSNQPGKCPKCGMVLTQADLKPRK